MTTLPPLPSLCPPRPKQPCQVRWQHRTSYVRVVVSGDVTPDDLMNVVRQAADDAPTWVTPAALIDLRLVSARLGFMQHLLIGQEMADCLARRLDMLAVVTNRDLPAMERAARASADESQVRFFLDEDEALDWLLGVEVTG